MFRTGHPESVSNEEHRFFIYDTTSELDIIIAVRERRNEQANQAPIIAKVPISMRRATTTHTRIQQALGKRRREILFFFFPRRCNG